MSRTRTYGEGEIRIGTAIYLCDDIYSIGFISQLRDDIMQKHLNILTGKLVEKEDESETAEDIINESSTTLQRKLTQIEQLGEDEDM